MLDEGNTPAIIKVDGDDIGLCSTIQIITDIPETFCSEISLQAKSVNDTKWEEANKEIAIIVIPTVFPLPFGMDIKSAVHGNDFIEEMQKISEEYGFWAKMMVDAHKQYASDFVTSLVEKICSLQVRPP